jgi:hypothetical protein
MGVDQRAGTSVERISLIQQSKPDACIDVKSLRHLSAVEMVVVAFGDPCSAPSPNPDPAVQKMLRSSNGLCIAVRVLG